MISLQGKKKRLTVKELNQLEFHSGHAAVKASGNEKLRVKLSTAVDMKVAHAIDIKYHKNAGGIMYQL